MDNILLLLMAFCGLLTHFLKAMIQQQITDKRITPIQYWRAYPYQTLISVIGCIVGYVVLAENDQLTAVTAYGTGYMANSVADIIGGRVGGKYKNV